MDCELSPSLWLPGDVNTVGLCITVGERLVSRAQTNPSLAPGAGEALPAREPVDGFEVEDSSLRICVLFEK